MHERNIQYGKMRLPNLMELYLLRHGIADDDSPTGKDADRPLTEEGRRKLRDTIKTLAAASVKLGSIVSSPYVRAKESAEIAKEILGFKDDLLMSNALTPEADPQDLWQEIRSVYRGSDCVMFASHEPFMSRCTAYLLGTPALLVDFKKGAVVRIDIDQFGIQPRGVLKWMLVPKLARS
jgi:phosphohistidine phosphatase